MPFRLGFLGRGGRRPARPGVITVWQLVLGIIVAVFVLLTVLSAFAPSGSSGAEGWTLPAIIPLAFFLTVFSILVWGFATSLRPPSHAAIVMLLPWTAGVALLGRGLYEELCPAGWHPDRWPSYCQVEWGMWTFKGLPPTAWIVVLLCLMPFLMSFCMAMLVAVRHGYRRDVAISVPEGTLAAERTAIQKEWEYERGRSDAIESSVAQQALIYGALVSLTLIACVLVIAPSFIRGAMRGASSGLVVTAIGIGAAAAASFLVTAGRTLVRVASHEAGSRTFAWATKLHFIAVLSAALLGLLLWLDFLPGDEPKKPSIALVGGLLIGFLGGRATQAIVERAAASVSGLKFEPRASKESDLIKLDGIDQHHIDHFVEEGIASIYHLAHAPTPRLFFLTQYSLRMICEWQSQALLFDMLQDTTKTFRIAHGVRGAIDARRKILRDNLASPPKAPPPPFLQQNQPIAPDMMKLAQEDLLAKQLLEYAPEVERLDCYQRSHLVVVEWDGEARRINGNGSNGLERRSGTERRTAAYPSWEADRRSRPDRRHQPDRRIRVDRRSSPERRV